MKDSIDSGINSVFFFFSYIKCRDWRFVGNQPIDGIISGKNVALAGHSKPTNRQSRPKSPVRTGDLIRSERLVAWNLDFTEVLYGSMKFLFDI